MRADAETRDRGGTDSTTDGEGCEVSDYETLLAAVLADPDSDAPRLILADWLEENGEPERAEFIRVQSRLAELKAVQDANCGDSDLNVLSEIAALRRRQTELFPMIVNWFSDIATLANYAIRASDANRGFVSSITCSWADWLTHADAIRASTPLRKVRLMTRPDYDWTSQRNPRGMVGNSADGLGDWVIPALAAEWPGIEFELPIRFERDQLLALPTGWTFNRIDPARFEILPDQNTVGPE